MNPPSRPPRDPRDPLANDLLPAADRLSRGRAERLWLDGDPSALAAPLVALVGTRDPDPFGLALTQRIAAELAERGVGVLSGGALGVDAAAHRGALGARGRTVVVLPSGLGHWYPRRHEGLFREVLEGGGALVSQFPPETPPSSWTFPRRNELVACLADVLVVVQAPAKSGALLAAEAARRLGRRVMAVPASPSDRRGRGCVQLLRAGALACVGADDVFAALANVSGELFAPARRRARGATPAEAEEGDVTRERDARHVRSTRGARAKADDDRGTRGLEAPLDGAERVVYDSLASAPRHVDEISRQTGLSASEVQRTLLTLVLSGCIEERGGGVFARSK